MQQSILSVSELVFQCRNTLETNFPLVLLQGEISNFATPRSGHWYFVLKDQDAQVRCCMFRNANLRVHFNVSDGQLVLIKARVSLYEARGEFQIIAESMEPAGLGLLQQQFEQLKQRLQQQGLFDAAHKQPLPKLIKRLAVITSPTGAAIKDILTVLKRRFAALPITIYPSLVQGKEAPAQLIQAIQQANQDGECDVILLSRGGGSLEDLWCFNDEALAHAIFDSRLPIVSAVGHEVDFSIADFVADIRCATPSAAAELLSPDKQQLSLNLRRLQLQLQQNLQQRLQQLAIKRQHLEQRLHLQHPEKRLQQHSQRLDELQLRLLQLAKHLFVTPNRQCQQLTERLKHQSPHFHISQQLQQQVYLQQRLHDLMYKQLHLKKQQLALAAQNLETLSPLATLARGYGITKAQDGAVITQVKQLSEGMLVSTQLQDGEFISQVHEISLHKN